MSKITTKEKVGFGALLKKRRERERNKEQPLTNEQWENQIIDWCDFYRKNWEMYAKYELGIPLYPFQMIWLHLMGVSQVFYLMCGRGLSKSFMSALSSFVKALLYPNSEIVLTATTIKTAKKMVKNKMENELCGKFSKKLKYMKDKGMITFTYNQEDIKVDFTFNGSWIMVLPETESSRGERATDLYFEEVRLMKQSMIDSVFMPMRHARVPIYMGNSEYTGDPRLVEKARIVYLTSTRYKYEPFFRRWVKTVENFFNNDKISYNIMVGDVETAIAHNLFTREDYEIAIDSASESEIDMEYKNIPIGDVEGSFFHLEEFKRNSIIVNGFLPPTNEEYVFKFLKGELPFFREKKGDEKRVIYVDFAFSDTVKDSQSNDQTVIGCMSGYLDDEGKRILRNTEYMETFSGGAKDESLLRIRELFHFYDADYLLLDTRNGGEDRWQELSKPYYHEELGISMRGLGISNDNDLIKDFCDIAKAENLRSRVVDVNPHYVTIPVIGTSERNNNFHIAMKNALNGDYIRFLMDEMDLKKELEEDIEFTMLDSNERIKRLIGHIQIDFMINEAIKLKQELKNGFISLKESSRLDTKDRIVATEYANYLFHLLEVRTLKEEQEQEFDIEDWSFLMGG